MKARATKMNMGVRMEEGTLLRVCGMDELKNGQYIVTKPWPQEAGSYFVRYVWWPERAWNWIKEKYVDYKLLHK